MRTRSKCRVLGTEGRKLEGAQDLEDFMEQNYHLCLGLPLDGNMRKKYNSRLFNPLLFWISITCSEPWPNWCLLWYVREGDPANSLWVLHSTAHCPMMFPLSRTFTGWSRILEGLASPSCPGTLGMVLCPQQGGGEKVCFAIILGSALTLRQEPGWVQLHSTQRIMLGTDTTWPFFSVDVCLILTRDLFLTP